MNAAAEVIWEGPDEYRPFLVPIDTLEPFPGNPRRGNRAAVAASLQRFGQAKLSVVRDGNRIVAGHHVVEAARDDLGWTHVAAPPMPFRDEDEQRAFLLADNRTSDLGAYDDALLVDQLRVLAEIDALQGTGYTNDDLDDLLARVAYQQQQDGAPVLPPVQPSDPPLDLHEVVLMYSKTQRDQFERWLKTVSGASGTNGVSETVYEAVRIAAAGLKATV